MQQKTPRVRHALRTALCTVLPWASWGCSPELALGDVSARERALEQAPLAGPVAAASPLASESESPAPPDFTPGPQLAPPDVNLRIDTTGSGEVAIAGVGDLDGDGFADFAVEGVQATNGVEFVHLRYGGPRPTEPNGSFALEQGGARLLLGPFLRGAIEVIQAAGDVDGDGFGDLLIGLVSCYPAEASEGAYLLYGGPERLSGVVPLEQVAVQLRDPREPLPSSESSCAIELDPHLAALGDHDGDGFDDFVIADQRSSGPNTAYLFYGSRERLSAGASLLDASARLVTEGGLIPIATGDVNGDGTGDLILSVMAPAAGEPHSLFVPGARQRHQGDVDPTSIGKELGGLLPFTTSGTGLPRPTLNSVVLSPPDVDGDGLAELVLWSLEGPSRLFYGQPGLFAAEVELAESVVLDNDADLLADLWFAGDRDGDGDAELLSRFYAGLGNIANDVALLGGSRQRASGSWLFPVQAVLAANPASALGEEGRFLEGVTIAGDLDGDGAGDLLTTSTAYLIEGNEVDGFLYTGSDPELHIHYGVPGSAAAPLR